MFEFRVLQKDGGSSEVTQISPSSTRTHNYFTFLGQIQENHLRVFSEKALISCPNCFHFYAIAVCKFVLCLVSKPPKVIKPLFGCQRLIIVESPWIRLHETKLVSLQGQMTTGSGSSSFRMTYAKNDCQDPL